MTQRHPARYTDALLPVFAELLDGATRVLDPFGGTGKIFELEALLPYWVQIEAIEIEPEWQQMHPKTTLGNALSLPWRDGYFSDIVTSPTYGNRMADCHTAKDASRRNTYTHCIGRKLHSDNSGAMQWGDQYREFHAKAWAEAKRVLCSGGHFILNIKDHIRAGKRQHVTDWHRNELAALGFIELRHIQVACPGQRFGANGDARIGYESVILFENGMN
jgi:hypothetical protein